MVKLTIKKRKELLEKAIPDFMTGMNQLNNLLDSIETELQDKLDTIETIEELKTELEDKKNEIGEF